MVYRNNNLKDNTKVNEGEIPVYPFFVDVPSFPERKYLVGVYRFARMSYIALFVAILLCLFIVFRAFSRKISPRFVKWNNVENQYEYVPFSYSLKPKFALKEISYSEYLNQYFIRNYIEKRFSVFDTVQNYNNWCDCKEKTKSKMGVFNVNEECYLCKYSSSSVYKFFVDNVQNAYTTMSEDGISRSVNLLNIEFKSGSETNPELSVIEWILNKTKPIIIRQTYRIDFVVNEYKNNTIKSRDVLIGYITISGPKTSPQKRSVISESFMFNPNADLLLKEYSEEINAIK